MVATLHGDKRLLRKLNHLKGAAARRVMRGALNKASTPILKDARKKAPVDTKALRKSLGRKSKTYRNGNVVVLVGPRTGHRDEKTGRVPTRYAHLAERAKPYLRPAYDDNKAKAGKIIAAEVSAGIAKEAAK